MIPFFIGNTDSEQSNPKHLSLVNGPIVATTFWIIKELSIFVEVHHAYSEHTHIK